jgi:hypothetical protein
MKRIIIYLTLTFACGSAGKASETLLLVSGIPYHMDERTYEITQRPVLFAYNEPYSGLDTVLRLSPPEPFMNVKFIGLYNTFGLLVVLKSSLGNASQLLTIVNLNTLQQDSVKFEKGVGGESNLFVLSPDSIYYSVSLMETRKTKGFSAAMKSKDFVPGDYNYAYIQGEIGTPVDDREFLILYNEQTNNNALHISKGSGYGLKVGPYLERQPPKDMYNAYPPALKAILVKDFHCTIVDYDYSRPNGSQLGTRYVLVYDKNTNEWYKHTFKGNISSIRSYDNGWVAGTIRDMDQGRYFDKTTMTYGEEYDFKREIPGYEEREPIYYDRTDGVWGDCFDERAQNFGTYYPGLLYLFNVHTKDYIEWDTKQGDSEVLLVQDGMVYYRVNTKILKSAIINDKALSEPELLIDDVRVRDIHWAYLK